MVIGEGVNWRSTGSPLKKDIDWRWMEPGTAAPDPATMRGDLFIMLSQSARSTDSPASSSEALAFMLTVHDITSGSAEIDLDDTTASLAVVLSSPGEENPLEDATTQHLLGGHLSITRLSWRHCPLARWMRQGRQERSRSRRRGMTAMASPRE